MSTIGTAHVATIHHVSGIEIDGVKISAPSGVIKVVGKDFAKRLLIIEAHSPSLTDEEKELSFKSMKEAKLKYMKRNRVSGAEAWIAVCKFRCQADIEAEKNKENIVNDKKLAEEIKSEKAKKEEK